MKEDGQKKAVIKEEDPFKKTFLEKIRESVGGGVDARQHVIKAKLHWFAQSEIRRKEIEQVIDKKMKLSSMQKIINENRGINYATESLDGSSANYNSVDFNDEYLQMVREARGKNLNYSNSNNNIDFSVEEEQSDARKAIGSTKSEILAIECRESAKQKTTTELFLSTQNYAMGQGAEPAAEKFSATKLWALSDDYMPGEKWDPSESFEPLLDAKIEVEQVGFMDEASRMIGLLIAKNDPSIFASEAI